MNDDLSILGIPKILQEEYNFDIFGILDISDKSKEFFNKQQLIKFKKIWFLHDNISNIAKNPDIKYLTSFEENYKINLWQLAINERFFNKFNEFYKFSKEEILSILEQECKLFEKILDDVKPDFLIMGHTTLHHNLLFFKIAKKKGIKILMLRQSYLAGKYHITSDADRLDSTQRSNKHNFSSLTELQNYIKNEHSKTLDTRQDRLQSSNMYYLKAALKYLRSSNSNEKTHYTYYGRTKSAVLSKTMTYTLKKRYRERFMNKNLLHNVENKKPFIYFPLHMEQERSLLIAAPIYTNQIEVIRNIVKSLPVGYELYVKEHPLMVLRGWRSISDYKEIMNLHNVKLFHPSVKSIDIIKKSSLVISIKSTTSLEAAFYNKPSIIFVNADFSSLPSVHQIKTINELPDAIRTSLKKEIKISDLNNYLNLIEGNSFEIDIHHLSQSFGDYFHYGSLLVNVEIPINKMKSYLEENRDYFEKLVNEFIKKIEKYEKKN